MDVVIIGGGDPRGLLGVAARTFGRLPQRGPAPDPGERRSSPRVRSGLEFRREVDAAVGEAHVSVVYPTGDGLDAVARRELELLAAVLDNHVRLQIREKLGAAYAPQVTTELSETFPGVGMIRIDTECDASRAEAVLQDCLAIGDALARNGVTEAELEEVRALARTFLGQALREDEWWLSMLHRLRTSPEEIRKAERIFDEVTWERVQELARELLPRSQASTAVVTPRKSKD